MDDVDFKRLQFSLNIFHMYGHELKCQLLYSPRMLPGNGIVDGESPERFWSGIK